MDRTGHYSVWKLMPLMPSQGKGLRPASIMDSEEDKDDSTSDGESEA